MESSEKTLLELYDSIICIDDYNLYQMSGRIYHSYREQGITFTCIWEMVSVLEDIFDEMDFPQKSMDIRSFIKCKQPVIKDRVTVRSEYYGKTTEKKYRRGVKATFSVQVLFRQNASWQGTVCWLETEQVENFRSIYELCRLMESTVKKT